MLQAPVPVTETGIGKAMLIVPEKEISIVLSPPHGAAHTSLPNECAITIEQSHTEDRGAYSLPEKPIKEAGATHPDNNNFTPLRLGSTPHSVSTYETDTEPESDFDAEIYPRSAPLTSLRPDPNGGQFMVSGSVSVQLDSETSSRATMGPQRQLAFDMDAKSDKQITETEEITIEEGANMQPNNDVSAL